jgi:hypothetical protein
MLTQIQQGRLAPQQASGRCGAQHLPPWPKSMSRAAWFTAVPK